MMACNSAIRAACGAVTASVSTSMTSAARMNGEASTPMLQWLIPALPPTGYEFPRD
jgi:hypothetical protein